MGGIDCCEKQERTDDILNEIFKGSPEDDKVPNDEAFFGHNGGEYPQDNGNPARFQYEARYPSLRLDPPPAFKSRAVTPQPQGFLFNKRLQNIPLKGESNYLKTQNELDSNSPNYIKNLLLRCEINGPAKPCDDFNLNEWKRFYPHYDKFFNWKKGDNIIENQTKIINSNDLNNVQIYEGEMNYDNQRHGFGKLTTPQYVRIGTWRNDKFTGWGRESRRNGEVVEGKFVNGLINGKGIFMNSKGAKYIGEFVDSRKQGKGELTTTKIHYNGEFNNNKMDGKGKIEFLSEGHKYEGQFHANEINGNGKFTWHNGDVYEGEMMNGKMHGYGRYKYHDGTIYEGYYANGIKEGHGKIKLTSGKTFEGEFLAGVPIKNNTSRKF